MISEQERRLQPRFEPIQHWDVVVKDSEGKQHDAQVLDYSQKGMRLLFDPAWDLIKGASLEITDPGTDLRFPASVMWCRLKNRRIIAGVRKGEAQRDWFNTWNGCAATN